MGDFFLLIRLNVLIWWLRMQKWALIGATRITKVPMEVFYVLNVQLWSVAASTAVVFGSDWQAIISICIMGSISIFGLHSVSRR